MLNRVTVQSVIMDFQDRRNKTRQSQKKVSYEGLGDSNSPFFCVLMLSGVLITGGWSGVDHGLSSVELWRESGRAVFFIKERGK